MLGRTMLTTMFEYNDVTNTRILEGAAKLSDEQLDTASGYSQDTLRKTLWHTLIVEYGWRSQCQGVDVRQQPPPVESIASVADFQRFQKEENERAHAYIAGLSEGDLAAPITLKRRDGSERALARWQILAHILYHSAQHRSEMAELLTHYGHSPGDLDFVFYITSGLRD
jgi:uncharacterized damage-inducible protein DinB